MNAKIFLRIAAVVMFFHALGHTFGVYNWKDPVDAHHQEVINQMTHDNFLFMGKMGGLGQFYEGFGYACTVAMLLVVALLWGISSEAVNYPQVTAKVLWPVAIFCLLLGVDELIWFFPFAASFSLLATVLIGLAIFKLKGS